ncbi:polysaccharide biosynthesis protein VpsQ [Gammaproteobacteria bacterium]
MKLIYFRGWLLLGGILLATVWWLSLTPSPPSANFPYADKVGHLLIYTIQMVWATWLWPYRRWLPALSLCVMGAMLEVLQGMTGYRTFEFADMAANTTGVLLGWTLAYTPLSRGLAVVDGALARHLGQH